MEAPIVPAPTVEAAAAQWSLFPLKGVGELNWEEGTTCNTGVSCSPQQEGLEVGKGQGY